MKLTEGKRGWYSAVSGAEGNKRRAEWKRQDNMDLKEFLFNHGMRQAALVQILLIPEDTSLA